MTKQHYQCTKHHGEGINPKEVTRLMGTVPTALHRHGIVTLQTSKGRVDKVEG